MRSITRFWAAAAQACLAELTWHLAGPAWAFGLAILIVAWHLPYAVMPASGAALEKARAVEQRLNAVVGKIPSPQASPGTHSDSTYSGSNNSYGVSNSSYGASNSSYSTSNSSYGLGGGTEATYVNTGVGNGGVAGCQTSGQIGGASAHYHTMAHSHTTSSAIESWGNALRNSHSDLVPAFNQLRDSHSNLVPAVNALRDSHSNLVPAVNALRDSHSNLVPLVNTLVTGHQNLTAKANTLITRLEQSGILH